MNQRRRRTQPPMRPWLSARLCSVLGVITVLVSARGQAQAGERVSPLPAPTGPSAVGTVVAHLEDGSRPDADFPVDRPITVQLWYPASTGGGPAAPYLVEPDLPAALLRDQYYGVDSIALGQWARLATHAVMDAPPAEGRHPLLLGSVGLGVIRANYTSIAEELASHGFVVALVESPLQGLMVLPTGEALRDSTGRYQDPVSHLKAVSSWARDLSFVVDRLVADPVEPALAVIAARVDRSRIGAFGHSTGGLVAVAACDADRRIRACVDMDGGLATPAGEPLADFVGRGVTQPILFLRSQPLYDDTTLARRGMTREAWAERGEAGRRELAAFAARSRGPVLVARVAGTGHFSFTDAPFVMPSAISRFGGRIIAADRGWTAITSTLRAFFDRQLGRSDRDLQALADRIPELTVERLPR